MNVQKVADNVIDYYCFIIVIIITCVGCELIARSLCKQVINITGQLCLHENCRHVCLSMSQSSSELDDSLPLSQSLESGVHSVNRSTLQWHQTTVSEFLSQCVNKT